MLIIIKNIKNSEVFNNNQMLNNKRRIIKKLAINYDNYNLFIKINIFLYIIK